MSWQPFRVALRAPFAAAHGALAAREGLLVAVREGRESGIGEASPLPSFAGGSVAETAAALATLAAAAAGKPLGEAWEDPPPLGSFSPGSAAAARGGFETAVADLLSRREGLPLYRWLAARALVPLSSETRVIAVNALVEGASPEAAAAQARGWRERGYTVFKVKVGFDLASDAERMAAVRAEIGPGAELRADANGAWTTDVDALRGVALVAQHGVALYEQPLPPSAGLGAMAALRRRSSVPVAVDEGCPSFAALQEVLRLDAADAVVIKPTVTGLHEAVRMVALAAANGLSAIVTAAFEAGPGWLMAAHVAALLPSPAPACGLSTVEFMAENLLAGVPAIEAGFLNLPGGPGLGAALDADALARCATGPRVEVPL